MRVYTRGGDLGKTSLFDGTRVPKSDPRVEVYGTIDELNSVLSLCRVVASSAPLREILERVQNELFTCGADFATPAKSKQKERVKAAHVERLEADTDRFFDEVGNPQGFVLPGETELGARLHLARTVARRAERLAVALSGHDPLNPEAIRYLNRLSSLLYALAVWTDKIESGKPLQKARYDRGSK